MPDLLYNLELDAKELLVVFRLLRSIKGDVLSEAETSLYSKVLRLMEGR
jgi:hypothetical protein